MYYWSKAQTQPSASNLLKQERNVRISKHQIYIDWPRLKPDLFDPHLHHFQEAFSPARIVHWPQPCVEGLLTPVSENALLSESEFSVNPSTKWYLWHLHTCMSVWIYKRYLQDFLASLIWGLFSTWPFLLWCLKYKKSLVSCSRQKKNFCT